MIQNAPEKFHPPQSPILPPRHIPRNSSCSTTGGPPHNLANPLRPNSHGQIIANIENNSHYERDWTLDDVSQVSFKPCPQGSGSLTPFHDSVHNMYENQVRLTSSDNSSHESSANEQIYNQIPVSAGGGAQKRTNELNLFKLGTEQLKYPSSAVFLENRDILNDTAYPKLYHRHSTVIISPDVTENLDKLLGKDTRRYSDTKLLQQQINRVSQSSNQIFNVTNILGPTILPTTSLVAVQHEHIEPQITDIIFERNDGTSNYDPLELNIQEMLELDIKTHQLERKSQLSLNSHNVNLIVTDESNYDMPISPTSGKHKNIFKSLPNLNASSENLLQ